MATILFVDDSRTIRKSVEFTLSEAGYDVLLAEDGSVAMTMLNRLDADNDVGLIVTDVHMPVLDGFSFIQEVKKSRFANVPILVMTTESEASMLAKGKELGAAGWLVKPFSREQLRAVAARFVPAVADQDPA